MTEKTIIISLQLTLWRENTLKKGIIRGIYKENGSKFRGKKVEKMKINEDNDVGHRSYFLCGDVEPLYYLCCLCDDLVGEGVCFEGRKSEEDMDDEKEEQEDEMVVQKVEERKSEVDGVNPQLILVEDSCQIRESDLCIHVALF